jgi:DNA excision repair protein ERCC-2
MKQHIHISVRELVAKVLRSGDLETGFFGTGRSMAGIQAHQKIQRSRPAGYQREVPVAYILERKDIVIELNGRIDGVFQYPEMTLEEIKTTTRKLSEVQAGENERHWAQLKVYAFLYAKINHVETLQIQLTYCHLPSGDLLELKREADIHDLERFFRDLVDLYVAHVAFKQQWRKTRDLSIHKLEFPYPFYRPGQKEFAGDVFRTIEDGGQLLAQAPTGIGKTVAVLFPALKSVAENNVERIFYLTARSTGKAVAEETLAMLRRGGLRLKCITLTAKEKICFNPGAACTGDECEFARGYYDRVDAALKESMQNDCLNRDAIESAARTHKICPFEFSLDLSLIGDCIIGDYNYAFDPQAYLKRFFLAPEEGVLFLVDEAHNLVDRSREMFSTELRRRDVLRAGRKIRHELPRLYESLDCINSWLKQCKKESENRGRYFYDHSLPDDLMPLLYAFLLESDSWLSGNRRHALREVILDMYFTVSRFMKVSELFDESYAVYYDTRGKDVRIKLFCVDPSSLLRKVLDKSRAAVFFSATLTPVRYYQKLFGCSDSARALLQQSPFPKENLLLLVESGISTYFRDRMTTRDNVAETIGVFVCQKIGNYLIFFPSYEYMTLVANDFSSRYPQIRIMQQSPAMTEIERESFLNQFKNENHETLVGFVVLGGVFGEGIDLLGDRLTGAVVVSVGQPPPTPERELIQDYFNQRDHAGFDFAYVFPGFNRVLQACGRVIRSETDRGSVLLIDRRYAGRKYTTLFPPGWQPIYVRNPGHMGEVLRRFWTE